MKRIRIDAGEAGLVYSDSRYKRFLTEGVHWVGLFDSVRIYDMARIFVPITNSQILLRDKELESALHVIDVRDHELIARFEQGRLREVLATGQYLYWKGLIEHSFLRIDASKVEIAEPLTLNDLQRKEFVNYTRSYTIEPHERGVVWIDGKFSAELKPGVHYFWKNATPVSFAKVDQRQQQLEISGQEILTKDKAMLRINFHVLYKVVDVIKALVENKEYEKQFYLLVQMALREIVGTLTLDELLDRKETISAQVLEAASQKAGALGVDLRDGGIRDIILPGDMKDIMNHVLLAQKKAEANVIMRREETASTRSLLNTARLMEDNTMLFKLKEMEYVEKIAEKISSISLSGGSHIVDQLKDIFVPRK